MPRCVASSGREMCTSRPSHSNVPESAGPAPEIVLINVDLPAPLSPTRATTSPAWTSKSTLPRACTGPKDLLTPRRRSRGVPCVGAVPAPAWVSVAMVVSLSGDAGFLAPGRVGPRAHLRRCHEPVLEHRVLDVVLRHGDRLELHGRDVRRAVVDLVVDQAARHRLALRQGRGDRRGVLGQRLDRLVDGHVLLVDEDPLDAVDLRVLSG